MGYPWGLLVRMGVLDNGLSACTHFGHGNLGVLSS